MRTASASTIRGEIRGRIEELDAEIDERIKQYHVHTRQSKSSWSYLEILRDELDELLQRRDAEGRMLAKLESPS